MISVLNIRHLSRPGYCRKWHGTISLITMSILSKIQEISEGQLRGVCWKVKVWYEFYHCKRRGGVHDIVLRLTVVRRDPSILCIRLFIRYGLTTIVFRPNLVCRAICNTNELSDPQWFNNGSRQYKPIIIKQSFGFYKLIFWYRWHSQKLQHRLCDIT